MKHHTPERWWAIKILREEKRLTYKQIGDFFDLSTERVRQIYLHPQPPARPLGGNYLFPSGRHESESYALGVYPLMRRHDHHL
jgi:hypothetical protein